MQKIPMLFLIGMLELKLAFCLGLKFGRFIGLNAMSYCIMTMRCAQLVKIENSLLYIIL